MQVSTEYKYPIHYHSECRLCGSKAIRKFLHFDNVPFADAFIQKADIGTEFYAPIDIYWCADCKSVQTLHDVDVREYYNDYHYTVANSPFAMRFMELLADKVVADYGLQPDDSVIDIGSSDGYQLKFFQERGMRVLGYEPSAQLTKMALENGVPTVDVLFTAETTDEIPADMRPVKAVVLLHTFDHLLDPKPFLQAVHKVIDKERGLLVIEVHNIAQIMERMETFLFAHEHATYLSAMTMKRTLEREGFKLLTADLIPPEQRRINSLLIVAAHEDSIHQPQDDLTFPELAYLDQWETYADFEKQVTASYQRITDYVRNLRAQGKRVAGYGMGGRGVTTLALCDFTTEDIAYVCDRNTNAQGLYTPRSNIPVYAPEHVKDDPVDEIIVFSFGYFDEIKQQLAEYVTPQTKFTSLLDIMNDER